MLTDLYENNKSVIQIGGLSLVVLMIALILSSPTLALLITFGIALLISMIIILGGIYLDYFIGNWISLKLLQITWSENLVKIYKIIGIIGLFLSTYSIVKEIINIEWEQWGIRPLYIAMSSKMELSSETKYIFESNVWPKYFQVLKALCINIGTILISFITNYVPPFCWIFSTIGLFKNE